MDGVDGVFERGLASRRVARDPELRARFASAVGGAADDVHRRRVAEWVRTGRGSLPIWEDSLRVAEDEVGLLCRGLGSLVAVRPRDIDRACDVVCRDLERSAAMNPDPELGDGPDLDAD